MNFKCPGSQKFSQPYPEEKICPFCGKTLEIWSDESKAICSHCQGAFTREMQMGCLSWCRYAKECVGEEVLSKYKESQQRIEHSDR